MKLNKSTWIVFLVAIVLVLSACGSVSGTQTPPTTRIATQTPIYIYVPITVTPEPATITPLPTAVVAVNNTPTRTPTKAVVVKTATKTATKAPVTLAPAATATPSCNIGTVTPTFPEDGAPRNTRADGSGGSAIIFKWTPPSSLSSPTDPSIGYMIQMESRRGGQHINGDAVYVSANKYLQDGQFIYDPRKVSNLAAGDDAVVTWNVTIVKASGNFNDTDYNFRPPGLINCGTPSQNMSVRLLTQ